MKKLLLILIVFFCGCTYCYGPITGTKYHRGFASVLPENPFFNVRHGNPESAFVRECKAYFIQQNPNLSDRAKQSISEGKIYIGMTKGQVTASWGAPEDKNISVGSWGTHEQWTYGSQYVYIEDGILTSWQTN